jgi:RNA polymerase sigma-70 factor (ECF subfamily)
VELSEPNSSVSSLDEASDEELAQSVQEEQGAFLILYDRYVVRVQRYVYAHVAPSSEVDDLVSVIFLRALTRIDTYHRDRGTFGAWLISIARNATIDHRRALNRRTVPLDQAEGIREPHPSPEEMAILTERQRAIRQAFTTLTPQQRDALALRFLAEVSFADVGRALHTSEAAAKMLVHRGLLALRSELDREGSR